MNPGTAKLFDPSEVLAKAMELFWAQGYEATGMAQLVEHLGIGRQSLYNEFGDKRGLFLAALNAYADVQHREITEVLDRPGSPLKNLRDLCEKWIEMAEADECSGCLLANTAAEFGSRDEAVHSVLSSALRRSEDAFCGAFQRAIDARELSSTVSPRDLARLFMSAAQGVAVLTRLSGSNAMVASTARAILQLLPAAE